MIEMIETQNCHIPISSGCNNSGDASLFKSIKYAGKFKRGKALKGTIFFLKFL
jgi:hypothetical protein